MSELVPNANMETISLHRLLEMSTRAALDLQHENGSFPPGKNGIYDETMTPIRTTANWIIALTKTYDVSGDGEFKEAAIRASEYLMERDNRPYGYTFYARKSNKKDKCNELIGQARAIRALECAGHAFGRLDMIRTAVDVFKLHPFDEQLGLWEKVDIDGTYLSYDRTLNHQLLFAGAGSFLTDDDPYIKKVITCHLDKLKQNLRTRSDGIVRHYVRPPIPAVVNTVIKYPRHRDLLLNEAMHLILTYSNKRRKKEIGYQPLNLFALSWLKLNLPDHSIWRTGGNSWSIDELFSDSVKSRVFDSDIEYGTGQPGMSTAIGMHILNGDKEEKLREWVEVDIQNMFNPQTRLLDNVKRDPRGHAAGINLLSYLPNIEISYSVLGQKSIN